MDVEKPQFIPNELTAVTQHIIADHTPPTKHFAAETLIGGCVINKLLGEGNFAAVYSADYPGRSATTIALKVYKVGTKYEDYQNEVKMLNRLLEFSLRTKTTPPNIIKYYGTFAHFCFGTQLEPVIYPCIIFEQAGESVSKILKRKKGLALHDLKSVMRDLFAALQYLHRAKIIHCDVKTSNMLMRADNSVVLCDLGTATTIDEQFHDCPGTVGYCAPELLFNMRYDYAIDIWSAFAVCFRLLRGDNLFDVYGDSDLIYGEDIDDYMQFDDDSAYSEEMSGVSDDDSGNSADYRSIDYYYLMMVQKFLGPAPREMVAGSKHHNKKNIYHEGLKVYFGGKHKLKKNPQIHRISISAFLMANYDMNMLEADEIEQFLLCGLKYLPSERITAEAALNHEFLNS